VSQLRLTRPEPSSPSLIKEMAPSPAGQPRHQPAVGSDPPGLLGNAAEIGL
jgi:hypothetical protein